MGNARKEKAKRGNLLAWLNYRNKLTDQDPKAKYVVLYPMSATYLCAASLARGAKTLQVGTQRVALRDFLADYKTFYFETREKHEARYLAAILNSPTVDALIKPMQSRGLWGPRDICKKVLELPVPEFRKQNPKHLRLAELAEACEAKVQDIRASLKEEGTIGRARAAVRQALKNELQEIDSLVKGLLR